MAIVVYATRSKSAADMPKTCLFPSSCLEPVLLGIVTLHTAWHFVKHGRSCMAGEQTAWLRCVPLNREFMEYY